MRTPTPFTIASRGIALVVALGALTLGCGDTPTVASGGADSTEAPAPEAIAAPMPSTEENTPEPPTLDPTEPEASGAEAARAPEASAGRRAPVRPQPPVESAPLPERPPMPAPPPVEAPEPRAPAPEAPGRDTAGAEAFWARFQSAVRAQDRAAIERGLAESIRFGDQSYARASEPVQDVIRAIVEEDAARDAYLAVDRLTHTPQGSTFESEATYVVDGETYEVVVFGTVREVSPGQWRLVEVGSR